jgi:hypothetical protein
MFFDKRGDVPMNETFTPSLRTRIRRKAYAHYDEATVFKILDAGVLAHIGYVVDGAPYVTPTPIGARMIGSIGTAPPQAACCMRNSNRCRSA